MAGEGGAWVREGPREQPPLLVLPRVQAPSHLAHTTVASGISLFHKRLQTLLPIGPVWAPALAFPHLEEPGEDVKFEDGHVATAGEVDGGAQGEGCGA